MEEFQRYGRNKNTVINSAYINSGAYRKKFDKITTNDKLNHILYLKAKEMLFHRKGTLYEDMYWFDGDTGEVVASVLDAKEEKRIDYPEYVLNAIKGKNNLITMHTHPNSMPPSIADFNSCCQNKYLRSLIICHNGTVFSYTSNQMVPSGLYELYVQEFRDCGNNEKEAQMNALHEIKRTYKISFQEVE